jgi:3-hydroxyisobutyrate dehydrogenase-like beta-hydroxyacid dehydrogenase
MKVGFIGLGGMGMPMALNLIRGGHELALYNRTRSRAEEAAAEGGRVADSPADAARDADVVITMLANDAAVEETMLGANGALEAMPAGAVHCSMSTIGRATAESLEAGHRATSRRFVSAPVFGRPPAAAARKLWIVAAGAPDDVERCAPLFDLMGQGTHVVSADPWVANVVKLGGNFMIAAMIETLGEAFALVRKSGVESGTFLEMMNAMLFKSPIYESYGTLMVEERFDPAAFTMRLGLKDVRLVLEAATAAEVPMPLASLVRDQYTTAVARGMGDIDWAGLGALIADDAGLERKAGD